MAFFFQVPDVQPLESKGDTEKKQINNENNNFHGANDTVFVSWSRVTAKRNCSELSKSMVPSEGMRSVAPCGMEG